jgi:hypothetical protein
VRFDFRTAVVDGSLSSQMRRAAAARAGECGLQILTLPQVAARLAGGFAAPVTAEVLEPAVRRALEEGGFVELEQVRHHPGTVRAVARALRKVWDTDADLRAGSDKVRIRELMLIENRVRRFLPNATLTTRDLRGAALMRIRYAPKLLGPICIEGLSFIQPVWRPLVPALANSVPLEWLAPDRAETEWFSGRVTTVAAPFRSVDPTVVSCADPRHEVVESLRWARHLITSGAAKPHEIAFSAASSGPWDDHFLALSVHAALRVRFAHGIPALSTPDGQRCAALADLLLRGLSHPPIPEAPRSGQAAIRSFRPTRRPRSAAPLGDRGPNRRGAFPGQNRQGFGLPRRRAETAYGLW